MKFKILIIGLFFSIYINAQESKTSTIEDLFKDTYSNSGDWKEFKMIKRTSFKTFQKTILDTISLLKKDIKLKVTDIKEKQTKIDSLNTKISSLENQLTEIKAGETKNENLKITVIGIIIALVLALLFFIFRFKRSAIITKSTKINLTEMEEEFEKHRKKALDNEQKLRRQLQDEINKQRGV